MNTSKLVRWLRCVEAAIEGSTKSRAHCEALRHDLLDLVVLRRPPSRRLSRVVRDLRSDEALLERCGYVSAALHAMAMHKLSLADAAQMCGLLEQDIHFALALMERCRRTLVWVNEQVDDGVRAAIDSATMRLVVELAPSSVAEMVSAAIEAAAQRAGPTEMYGELYGHAVVGALDEKNERHHTVYVTRFALQATARANDCSVSPSRTSHTVHALVARALYNDGSIIVGDAHSHPWRSSTELMSSRGWRYSAADEEHCVGWQADRRAAGQRGYASIVVAVAPGSERGARARRLSRNRLRFRVGSWHVVIAVYRVQLDGDLDGELGLETPALLYEHVSCEPRARCRRDLNYAVSVT
jgi:hypothetical protein